MQMSSSFDVAAFVRTATDEIWNRQLLGRIPDLYAYDVAVHMVGRPVDYGWEGLVVETSRWLAAFPDGRVFVDDVFGSGDDERGYRASERRTLVGRNNGASVYGPATGRRAVIEAIVNYRIAGGQVAELWVEYDQLGLLRDLGLDAAPFAVPTEASSTVIGGGPNLADDGDNAEPLDSERLVRAALDEIWNRRLLGRAEAYLAESYRCHGPGGRRRFGREEYVADVLALVAAFPDLALHVDHQLSAAAGDRARISTAWTISGSNEGASPWGPPTGSRVRLSGISNHLVANGRILEEWRQYDELSLLRQLAVTAAEEAFGEAGVTEPPAVDEDAETV